MEVETSAETAYIFRHALMRDAAHQLQMPGDRARLHGLAFEIIEQLYGGRAPEPPPLRPVSKPEFRPHTTDAVAGELAEHAAAAASAGEQEYFREAMLLYLRRHAENCQSTFRSVESAQAWRSLGSLLNPSSRAESLRRGAEALHKSGHSLQAELLLKDAHAINFETGDPVFQGVVLGNLAAVYIATGRLAQAEEALTQALELLRRTGAREFQGNALANLAIVHQQRRQFDIAEQLYAQAMILQREFGSFANEGITLSNLGLVYLNTGRVELAEQRLREALAIHHATGDRRTEGNTLGHLGLVLKRRSHIQESERLLDQAIAIHRQVGNRASEGITLGHAAAVYMDSGRMELAEKSYRSAVAIHVEVGNRRLEGADLCGLALCLVVRGQWVEARATWLRGIEILRQLRDHGLVEAEIEAMRGSCAEAKIPPFEEADDVTGGGCPS